MTQTNQAPYGNHAQVNGINLYYETHGSGRPLVLLHGGGSTINTSFARVIPLLAKTHQVIALELQAHGRSEDRDTPVSFKQDAADVAALLKELEISKANIFGFSNGGQTAMEIGIYYPEIVEKLIVASAFYRRDGVPEGFWKGFDDPQFSDLPEVYKVEYRRLTDETTLLNMFKKDAARMKNFQDWPDEQISSIQAPTLVVSGDRDLPLPEHVLALSRLLPQGRLMILPGSHGEYFGEAFYPQKNSKITEAFVQLVNDFLEND